MRDAVFGVLDDELRILGAAHVARSHDHAELGVSVLPGHRGCLDHAGDPCEDRLEFSDDVLERAERLQPSVHAFVTLDADRARDAARA